MRLRSVCAGDELQMERRVEREGGEEEDGRRTSTSHMPALKVMMGVIDMAAAGAVLCDYGCAVGCADSAELEGLGSGSSRFWGLGGEVEGSGAVGALLFGVLRSVPAWVSSASCWRSLSLAAGKAPSCYVPLAGVG